MSEKQKRRIEMETIASLVENFASKIREVVEAQVAAKLRTTLESAFNGQSQMKKPVVSAKRAETMKIQGRYLGLIRHLNGNQIPQVKKITKEKGVKAGLKAAEAFAKKNRS